MRLSGISGHGAGGWVFQWGSTIKLPLVHTMTSPDMTLDVTHQTNVPDVVADMIKCRLSMWKFKCLNSATIQTSELQNLHILLVIAGFPCGR